MSLAGFETAIPARERPQTHILDRADNGIGRKIRLQTCNFVINERRFTVTKAQGIVMRRLITVDKDHNRQVTQKIITRYEKCIMYGQHCSENSWNINKITAKLFL